MKVDFTWSAVTIPKLLEKMREIERESAAVDCPIKFDEKSQACFILGAEAMLEVLEEQEMDEVMEQTEQKTKELGLKKKEE